MATEANTTTAPAGATTVVATSEGAKTSEAKAPEKQDTTAKAPADAKSEQEQKPTQKAEGGEAAGDKAKATPPAPADIEIKLPEGAADPGLVASFKTSAKDAGLNSAQAQRIAEAVLADAAKRQEEQSAAWRKAVEADKEIGGDNLAKTTANAARAMNAFVTPDFKEFLDKTGLGNHPEMVRLMSKVGAAIGDDSIAGTVAGGAAEQVLSRSEILAKHWYPNSNK